jgi:hypothetical protein
MGKRGRPHGSFDKSRNYVEAVAKMRALLASGTSEREASAIVGKELGIPASTLRKHLAKKPPATGPRLNVHRMLGELSLPTEVVTKEQSEEATRRYLEKQIQHKEEEDLRRAQANHRALLFQLGLPSPPPPPKKKPRK